MRYRFLGPPGPVVLPAPDELLPRRHGPHPWAALPVTEPDERDGEVAARPGEPEARVHELECRTAGNITDLDYEPDDAERYCICPELHTYTDRLAAEATAEKQAAAESMRAGTAHASQAPERRRRSPIGIVRTQAEAQALAQAQQALAAARSGTLNREREDDPAEATSSAAADKAELSEHDMRLHVATGQE